ncbi:MAG: ACP phosphodiesterase [Cytophagaceae bacterium]
MNYLGYAFICREDKERQVGALINEFVNVRDISKYNLNILQGIKLHELLSDYTHSHEAFNESKSIFPSKYSKLAEKIIPVFYDHFLASDWKLYNQDETLESFAHSTYGNLVEFISILPPKMNKIIPYMISGNWLVNYASIPGLNNLLKDLIKVSTGQASYISALESLMENYSSYKKHFSDYFPDVVTYKNFIMENQKELLKASID